LNVLICISIKHKIKTALQTMEYIMDKDFHLALT
jgi:hypothetical protein